MRPRRRARARLRSGGAPGTGGARRGGGRRDGPALRRAAAGGAGAAADGSGAGGAPGAAAGPGSRYFTRGWGWATLSWLANCHRSAAAVRSCEASSCHRCATPCFLSPSGPRSRPSNQAPRRGSSLVAGAMFDGLSASLTKAFKGLNADGRLTAENIKEPLRDVRRALLEADVSLPVVRRFIQRVRAVGGGGRARVCACACACVLRVWVRARVCVCVSWFGGRLARQEGRGEDAAAECLGRGEPWGREAAGRASESVPGAAPAPWSACARSGGALEAAAALPCSGRPAAAQLSCCHSGGRVPGTLAAPRPTRFTPPHKKTRWRPRPWAPRCLRA
jgi:hypothetical protein